jgi:hypothetical protein
VRLREIACVGAPRTLLAAELGDVRRPLVVLSGGMHGDEPAGAWALLGLVADGLLDPAFSYRLWPCLNPTGFAAGTRRSADDIDVNRSFGGGGRSPEARAVLTANRDRRFVLWIDLHEDVEAEGFYLFEALRPAGQARFASAVTTAVAEAGFGLQERWEGFEIGPPGSDVGQALEPGAVIVDADREAPAFGRDLPLGLVVAGRAVENMLTFESPAQRPWSDRLATHRVAVVSALARLRAMIDEGTSRKAAGHARTR